MMKIVKKLRRNFSKAHLKFLPLDFCSHRRSWGFFAESVRTQNEMTFKAVRCASWRDFTQNNCPDNSTEMQSFMGYYAGPDLCGDYFLQTNRAVPFNRGPIGVAYDETIDDFKDELNDI